MSTFPLFASILAEIVSEAEPKSMMGRAQMMMFGGFLMLGWVLARRTIRQRKLSRISNRSAQTELNRIRQSEPSLTPLADAPAEVQRWQGAMHDLQRDLSAQLEDRIAVVQSLINQVDTAANHGADHPPQKPSRIPAPPISGRALTEFVRRGIADGRDIDAMADEACVDPGEIRWTIATLTPTGKVAVG